MSCYCHAINKCNIALLVSLTKRNEIAEMKLFKKVLLATSALSMLSAASQVNAAIALDRTRVIVNGGDTSVSLSISNENKKLPYLAQGWIEDSNGNKISNPMTVLPPVQRVEPGAKSQVKVQISPSVNSLPQDKESVFYFNLREIPPRSSTPNTLQIALQTRIKLFYRPTAVALEKSQAANGDWVNQVTLQRQGDKFIVNNPTPYFLTLVEAFASAKGQSIPFTPVMASPKAQTPMETSAASLGNNPVLTYVNDYGGRPKIQFTCNGSTCNAKLLKDR